MPSSLDADLLSPSERLDEIAEILAVGIARLHGVTRMCAEDEAQGEENRELPPRPARRPRRAPGASS